MRRIVFAVIGLLALFTIIRAYAEEGAPGSDQKISGGTRYLVHPGVVEFESGESGVKFAFGLLERSGEGDKLWNIFPLRIVFSSGDNRFSLALNGLSFLTRSGVRIGKPIEITGVQTGDVISIGGIVTIDGTVEGDVWTLGADIVLLPGALVTGDVIALGGIIEADKKSHIKGNKHSLENIKIPFIGLLSSNHSAYTFRFMIELMGIILFLLALFLLLHFYGRRLGTMVDTLSSHWKGALLYLVLALLILPVVVLLLVASIIGIIIVPFLLGIVIVLVYVGYIAAAVRLGSWLRRGEGSAVYTSGLLGLLLIRGPVVLGILFSLLSSELFQGIGRFLLVLGAMATTAACIYGWGGMLRSMRAD